ncbi:hypothetical protein Tco_1097877, partial [Tanacetum coccineum]
AWSPIDFDYDDINISVRSVEERTKPFGMSRNPVPSTSTPSSPTGCLQRIGGLRRTGGFACSCSRRTSGPRVGGKVVDVSVSRESNLLTGHDQEVVGSGMELVVYKSDVCVGNRIEAIMESAGAQDDVSAGDADKTVVYNVLKTRSLIDLVESSHRVIR